MTLRWMDKAKCRGEDPRLFHPSEGGVHAHDEALAICGECEVRLTCLSYALSVEEPYRETGVWGGLTPLGRLALRRAVGFEGVKVSLQ